MRHLVVSAIALLFTYPAQAQLAEPNTRGVTFCHVHLNVADRELHKKLWTELFDATLIEKEGYAAISVPGALLFLTEAEPTAPSKNTAMDHFAFRVQDLEEVLAKWRVLGNEVDSKSPGEDGFPRAYLTMPGGIRLELQEDPLLTVKTRMDHVHFFTPQNSELMAWYADIFGAIPPSESNKELAAQIPGSGLTFSKVAESRLPTDGTAIDHIGFEVEDWDAVIEMIRDEGLEFEFGPVYVESLDIWVAFFNDPSGVLVEVSHGLDKF